jgi:cytochrome c oxidase subunit I+III
MALWRRRSTAKSDDSHAGDGRAPLTESAAAFPGLIRMEGTVHGGHGGATEHHGFWRKWLFTTDHKEVGILYFVTSLWFLLIGGILAMLFRTQLMFPEPWSFLTASQFNQAISMHGMIMVFFFLSALGSAFANYFIPLQIGAGDVAFPRFNAFSYWMYLFGGLIFISGFFLPGGAAQGGWTNYAPLNSITFMPGPGETMVGLGLLMLWGSITMGTVNLMTTVLVMRGPGMTWWKVPYMTWFLLFTQILFLFSVPSILAGTLALITDRSLGTLFFANPGGGSVLWTDMWWFFAHPEVYIVLLPGLGAVGEVVQAFSGRPVYAKKAIMVALGLGLVPFSYALFGHHMFLTGINVVEREIFDINTEINTIPSGVIVIATALTLIGGSVKLKTPMLFGLGAVAVFVIGGITGVFDSSVFLDQMLRGGYQVVGHFHYIMVGAAEFGLFAGIYYYLPLWTGRMYNETLGKVHFVISFVSFNVIFFPMFYLIDMPRRIYTYAAATGWGTLNFVETWGAWIFGVAQILLLVVMIQAFRGKGEPSGPNPWGVSTPEWTHDLSAYVDNYPDTRYRDDVNKALSWVPPTTPLNISPFTTSLGAALFLSGFALYVSGIPNASYYWPLAVVGVVVVAIGVGRWFLDDLNSKFQIPDEPERTTWPFGETNVRRVGAWLYIATEVVLFSSLIGAYFFIRGDVPIWPSPGSILNIPMGIASTLVFATSALTAVLALEAMRSGNKGRTMAMLGLTLILGAGFLGLTVYGWMSDIAMGFTLSSGLPGSIYYFMSGIHAAHVLAGSLIIVYLLTKTSRGGYTKDHFEALELFTWFWAFLVVAWAVIFPLLYLI